MAGIKNLGVYDHLTDILTGDPVAKNTATSTTAISADYSSPAIDIRATVRFIVRFEWSGYDGTTGKVFLQLSDDPHATDDKWENWGGSNAQGAMDAASGSCMFHIWQSAPGYMRVRVLIGDGTTASVGATYRLKNG